MGKKPRSQAQNQDCAAPRLSEEKQPPVRWMVQVEDEPAAGRSPAEAGLAEERHGPLAPIQAGEGVPPASCPVACRVSRVLSLSFDLRRAMRRLRRELNACQACPLGENCRFMSYFQGQVQAAITQVTEEWGLP
jgi:hypothetical protein